MEKYNIENSRNWRKSSVCKACSYLSWEEANPSSFIQSQNKGQLSTKS